MHTTFESPGSELGSNQCNPAIIHPGYQVPTRKKLNIFNHSNVTDLSFKKNLLPLYNNKLHSVQNFSYELPAVVTKLNQTLI